MKLSTDEIAYHLKIATWLAKGSKAKTKINGEWYALKDAARHYCGSEALSRKGVLRHYQAWIREGMK